VKENSIEEDVKIVNNFIAYFNKNIQDGNRADLTVLGEEIEALNRILSDYKRVLKENEELKDFKKQVTDIESTNFIKYKNYIPIQKVKDKIEYLDKQQKQWLEDRELKASDSEIIFARDFLQELLEGRK
jgi:hypothetical protein